MKHFSHLSGDEAYWICTHSYALNTVPPKPYEQMQYPGQRVRVDVKSMLKACHVGKAEVEQFYQYTAIAAEYSRFQYVKAFEEYSTYGLTVFLTHMLRFFKIRVEYVQTDNGSEFTNRFTSEKGKPTLFEKYLACYGIRYKLIKPYTPRHNKQRKGGKAAPQERHRILLRNAYVLFIEMILLYSGSPQPPKQHLPDEDSRMGISSGSHDFCFMLAVAYV